MRPTSFQLIQANPATNPRNIHWFQRHRLSGPTAIYEQDYRDGSWAEGTVYQFFHIRLFK